LVSRRFFGFREPLRRQEFASGRRQEFAGGRRQELFHGLWDTIRRGLAGDLLWRRFSPGRPANQPLRVLERLDTKQFRQRKKALAEGGLNSCFLISIMGLAAECLLLAGEIVFGIMMINIISPAAISGIRENLISIEIFIFAAFCFNCILAESLYVCMGFGLYVNSRIELEGWDLELLFRKLAAGRKIT
jgi:hypothetical protein